MAHRWRIELLGGLRVSGPEAAITRFRTQKTGALLAYLAYFPHRSHRRDELTELFWPDDDYDASRHKLSVALSWLRQQFEPPGVPDGSVLITDRLCARLNPAAGATDVAVFEQTLEQARSETSADARRVTFERALEVYRGRLLPGFYDEWVLPEQRRLESLYLEARRALVETLERTGDYPAALRCAVQGLAIDPLDESQHALLIRLYLATGQRLAALRQYDELTRLLQEEFGTGPGAEVTALVAELKNTPAGEQGAVSAKGLVRPPPLTGPDNGQEDLDPVGGAVPLDSPFYVVRPADEGLRVALARKTSLVLVKGARQVGKTSLLARGLEQARQNGARVVCSDLQLFNAAQLASAELFLRALARSVAEAAGAEFSPDDGWDPEDGPNMNFRRFMRQLVLADRERHFVWGLDEVDRLFTYPYGSEVFALFRTWHNERALDPHGPWSRLTLVIAYATEAHLFITDVNQSPFNVGTRLALEDFSREQVADLNRRYGTPLRTAEELGRFYRLLGGHPYLVRRGLLELRDHGLRIGDLESGAIREDWIFGDQLRRLRALITGEPALQEAVARILRRQPPELSVFYRLRSAGIAAGAAQGEAQLRCLLYARYLEQYPAQSG